MKPQGIEDSMLETASQEQIRELVSGLPEESLSMAWRSSLNEKLRAVEPVRTRRRWTSWALRPAVAFAMAGAMAVVVFTRQASPEQPIVESSTGALEASLVRDHFATVQLSDMAGSGLNPVEATPTSYSFDSDWTEVDLDSL